MSAADWRASRILLIGQAPGPTGPPPGRPLVGGKTGTRLQALAGCETVRDYLRSFDTVNLISTYPGRAPGGKGDSFPMAEARIVATAMKRFIRGRRVVFVGGKVMEAFGVDSAPFLWQTYVDEYAPEVSFEWAMIPHPSPVNRFWNSQANWDRARSFFAAARIGMRGGALALGTRESQPEGARAP